eukprot:jgi/Tetstr1/429006/TSEL_018981.t1
MALLDRKLEALSTVEYEIINVNDYMIGMNAKQRHNFILRLKDGMSYPFHLWSWMKGGNAACVSSHFLRRILQKKRQRVEGDPAAIAERDAEIQAGEAKAAANVAVLSRQQAKHYSRATLLAFSIFTGLDSSMVVGRTGPQHSWANEAERVMSVMNRGMHGCALSRTLMDSVYEKLMNTLGGMNAIRKADKDSQKAAAERASKQAHPERSAASAAAEEAQPHGAIAADEETQQQPTTAAAEGAHQQPATIATEEAQPQPATATAEEAQPRGAIATAEETQQQHVTSATCHRRR